MRIVFERGDADARGGDEEVLERDGMRKSAESFESERVTKIGVFVRGVSDGGRRGDARGWIGGRGSELRL